MNHEHALNIPAHLQGYTFRPAVVEDASAIHRLYVAMDQADGTTWAGSLEETVRDFSDPSANPQTDTLLAFSAEDEVAALGWIFVHPNARRAHRAHLWGGTHPAHRRRGLGSLLFGWSQQRGSRRLHEFHDDLSKILHVNCAGHLPDRIALFEKHGFHTTRYYYKMRRDLRQPIPKTQIPAGMTIQPYTPELDLQAMDTINEAFQDHYGSEPATPEIWKLRYLASDSFRPDCTFLVLEGDRVVGVSMNSIHADDNDRIGIKEGWIGTLGVRRKWRGRGLASLLLSRSMQAFKEAGMDYAGLFVDSENQTGALRIYERLGFEPIMRTIAWEKAPIEVEELDSM